MQCIHMLPCRIRTAQIDAALDGCRSRRERLEVLDRGRGGRVKPRAVCAKRAACAPSSGDWGAAAAAALPARRWIQARKLPLRTEGLLHLPPPCHPEASSLRAPGQIENCALDVAPAEQAAVVPPIYRSRPAIPQTSSGVSGLKHDCSHAYEMKAATQPTKNSPACYQSL